MGTQPAASPWVACAGLALALAVGCEGDEQVVNNFASGADDNTLPAVAITAPGNGWTLRVARAHPWTATASDNQLVASVSFYRDGIFVVTDTSPPFGTTITPATFGPPGSHVLTAVAFDGAGNSRTSAPVTITTVTSASAGGGAGTFDHSVFAGDDNDAGGFGAVAGGDLDGDGFGDLAFGLLNGDGPGNLGGNNGEVHVIRGGTSVAASLDLSAASASMVVYGADVNDLLGATVAIGDVTGDGLADLVIGVPGSQGQGNAGTNRGEVVVIAGAATLPASINLASTAPRSVFYGTDNTDVAGGGLAVADVNGDGIDDILVGAPGGDGPTNTNASMGEVYVVLGSSSLPTSATLASAAACIIYGIATGDTFGQVLAGGDLDNDGFRDVIGGAPTSAGNGGTSRGEVEVVGGRATWPATITLSSTPPVIRIQGIDNGDTLGSALAVADSTGDGIPELYMGAPAGDGPANGRANCGEVVALPGSSGRSGTIDLNAAVTAVYLIYGRDAGDVFGSALAAGSVQTLGATPDLIAGATGGDGPTNAGPTGSGEAYALTLTPFAGFAIDLAVPFNFAFYAVITLYGVDANDNLGAAVGSVDLNGDGFDDVAAVASAGDGPTNGGTNRGEAHVVVR